MHEQRSLSAGSIAILMLCNVVWALNVIVSKIAVDDLGMPPLAYAFGRSLLVALFLFPLLRPIPKQLGKVMLVGIAISGGSFALLFLGLKSASPSAAGIVSLSGAPLTVLFAILFLGERVRWKRGLGIALTFSGVIVAVTSPAGMQSASGLWLVFLAAVVGALGSVFVKQLKISSVRLQAWAGVASSILLAPLSLVTETGQMHVMASQPLELAGCLLFASLIVSVGAHSAYYRMLQLHETNEVVPLTLMTPLLTIALGAWLTGDPIGARLLIGGGIAIAGVAIIVLRPSVKMTRRYLVRSRL
ncbi:DMT family transporter [Tsuneonella mangrovi]|uniref:DMT family transporter n=1 Tax=Tsuneonella mangrovi TaxID=1982042 RepID=UPI001F0A398C|nr:DMT family transporter [Tsuneonella mangrovi]